MSKGQDPPHSTSILSDFELLLTKIKKLPGKEERIKLINHMACRIQAEKNNLEAFRTREREGQACSKDVVNKAQCEYSDIDHGQFSSTDECLSPPKKVPAVDGCPISECEYTASSAYLVKRHIEELHPSHQHQAVLRQKSTGDVVKQRMAAKEERRHECHLCGRAHRSEIALHVHVKAQHGDNEAGRKILRYTVPTLSVTRNMTNKGCGILATSLIP